MLNEKELKVIQAITETYYMKPVLNILNEKIEKIGFIETLDFLHEIITSAKNKVDILLEHRKESGIIKDISQARKSIAGKIFSNCILYLLLKIKEQGLLRQDIYITDKTQKNPFLEKFTVIKVGDETQKPDMDLVLYTISNEETMLDCIIISLKTSLRERAGQTYKWKLLLEIATTESSIKEKYDISYDCNKMPKVCFATVNFYNEINNPQHRGMFKFFDNSFIGKPMDSEFISRLSNLIEFANQQLEKGSVIF